MWLCLITDADPSDESKGSIIAHSKPIAVPGSHLVKVKSSGVDKHEEFLGDIRHWEEREAVDAHYRFDALQEQLEKVDVNPNVIEPWAQGIAEKVADYDDDVPLTQARVAKMRKSRAHGPPAATDEERARLQKRQDALKTIFEDISSWVKTFTSQRMKGAELRQNIYLKSQVQGDVEPPTPPAPKKRGPRPGAKRRAVDISQVEEMKQKVRKLEEQLKDSQAKNRELSGGSVSSLLNLQEENDRLKGELQEYKQKYDGQHDTHQQLLNKFDQISRELLTTKTEMTLKVANARLEGEIAVLRKGGGGSGSNPGSGISRITSPGSDGTANTQA